MCWLIIHIDEEYLSLNVPSRCLTSPERPFPPSISVLDQLGEKLKKGLNTRFMPVSWIGASSNDRQIHSLCWAADGR